MEAHPTVQRTQETLQRVVRWRHDQTWVVKAALALTFAAVTGATARFEIHLPWTPVPVTLQTFWVLLSAVILGRRYGPLSLGFYLGIGAAGAPWFAGGASGLGVLTGTTGGYLVGFLVAAVLVGLVTDSWVEARRFRVLLPVMLAGTAVIHLLGMAQLALVLDVGLGRAWVLGSLPFLAGDVVKAAAAAGLAGVVLPGERFGPELE